MSNMNPKSPYEKPSSETGYESVNKRSTLRDRSTGPSMVVILLAMAAIVVIGFLAFSRWGLDTNVAGTGTTPPSVTTETEPSLPPSGSTGSTPDVGGSATTPPTPPTPSTSGSGTTTTP